MNKQPQRLKDKSQGGPHLNQNAADGPSIFQCLYFLSYISNNPDICLASSRIPSEQIVIPDSHSAEDEILHGPSSNVSFLQQAIPKADPETDAKQFAEEKVIPDLLGFSALKSPNPAYDTDLDSPPDHLIPAILRSFYDFIHPVFPILHWPSFITMYNLFRQPLMASEHRSNRTRDDIVFHATLNMVLALGCQRSRQIPPSQRIQFANSFYKHSHRLVSIETLDFSSLEIVQLLLLRGIYLHYTTYADRCWNTIGVALRVAQSLGLHVEQTASPRNQLKREMRRRVWHTCITLDRYFPSHLETFKIR